MKKDKKDINLSFRIAKSEKQKAVLIAKEKKINFSKFLREKIQEFILVNS